MEMDQHEPRNARQYVSSIKVQDPLLCSAVFHRALQIFGAAGVCEDFIGR